MLVGIVSDTHGNVPAIQEVTRQLLDAGVHLVLHLGDDYLDTLFFEAADMQVVAVPGLYCPEYQDPVIPNRRLETLAGFTMLLTHSPEASRFDQPGDLNPGESLNGVDMVLYGHTHVPHIQEKAGVLWVNPGHLKAHDRRGHPLSYALLCLEPPRVEITIVGLATQQVLQHAIFDRSR